MKKYISVFIFVIIFACISFCCVVLNEQDCIDNIKLVTYTEDYETKISLIENNGKYYAFLPSHFQLEEAFFEYTSGCTLYLNDKEYTSSSLCSDLQFQKEYSMIIKNSFGFTVSNETLILYKSENIPSIFIDLTNGTLADINSDKSVEKSGTCIVIDNNNSISHSGTLDKIHGRGNGSWVNEKKSYNISFKKEVDLFGMGLATEWVLSSNSTDSSYVRSKIVYDFANKIGLQDSPNSRFVNLYIDGEYLGLYMLTEKIEIQENRVDIADLYEQVKGLNNAPLYTYPIIETEIDGTYKKSYNIPVIPEDITGGYLLELQLYDERKTFTSAFTTKDSVCFSFKSSPYVSWEQLEYISGYIQEVEDSFHNGNYDEYIDIDSWVKYYLIQEVFANSDNRSFFYYKNSDTVDSKLYAGPVWDYDIALGVTRDLNTARAFYINTWGWYSLLYKNDDFRSNLIDEYIRTFKPLLSTLIDETLSEYDEEIKTSYNMDKLRWTNDDTNSYVSLENHLEWFRSYLTQRISFLDEVWIEGKQVYTITTTSKPSEIFFTTKYYYSVYAGEQISQLPTPAADGYKFLGWFDSVTNEPYNPEEIPTSDRTFEARWEVDPEYNQSTEPVTISARLRSIISNNIELFITLSFFAIMIIFVLLKFYMDFRSKKKEGPNVKSK